MAGEEWFEELGKEDSEQTRRLIDLYGQRLHLKILTMLNSTEHIYYVGDIKAQR